MVNLLKFKAQAEYEDGRPADLTGIGAYRLYGELMRVFVKSKGGEFLYFGSCAHLMIGSIDVPLGSGCHRKISFQGGIGCASDRAGGRGFWYSPRRRS